VLHEHLQAHIVRKDRLSSRIGAHPPRTTTIHIDMRRGRVQLREQEPGLGTALVADDVPRDRKPVDEEVLRVRLGRLEQGLDVLVPFLLGIPRFSPFRDRAPVEDEDVEERVEEEDDFRLDRHAVEKNGLWWRLHCV